MRFIKISGVLALLALVVAVPTVLSLAFEDRDFQQPTGVVGTPYSFDFTARSGCPPYHYHIINGNFPPGLTLSLDGHIRGTPNTAGTWKYWVELYDDTQNGACTITKAQREFTINIDRGLQIQTSSLPGGVVNQPYSVQLAVDPGVTASWRVSKGNPPDGLTLATNGVLSGTPTKSGSFPFSVIATDTSNNRTAGASYAINILDPLKLTTSPTTLPQAEVGMVSTITITPTATGGDKSGPYTWSVTPSLPEGLNMDPATGAITGTPTAAGTFAFKLTVADVAGHTQSVDLSLTVAPKLKIDATQHIGPAKQGKSFSVTLKLEGGAAPIIWRASAGRFPAGITLDRRTGILSGTPKKGGRYRFVLEASDALGAKSVRNYLLIVTPKPVVKKHKKQ